MKHRPIIMSTPMVRATLDNLKTQTRRISFKCEVGDILWVRETWGRGYRDGGWGYVHKTDYDKPYYTEKWKPSIHMPREACRLFLEVTDVRRERLCDITEEDARAEGVENLRFAVEPDNIDCRYRFMLLWDSINAKRGHGWATNPVVDVITYRRVEQ